MYASLKAMNIEAKEDSDSWEVDETDLEAAENGPDD